MSRRVVVLTDAEIGVVFHPPVHRADAQCPCDDCVAQRNLRSKLMAALEHPGGITDEQVKRGALALAKLDLAEHQNIREGRPFSFGDKSKAALEAALFRGDGEQ